MAAKDAQAGAAIAVILAEDVLFKSIRRATGAVTSYDSIKSPATPTDALTEVGEAFALYIQACACYTIYTDVASVDAAAEIKPSTN